MSDKEKIINIPSYDHRLGRNIHHDPRSRHFAARRYNFPTADISHRRYGEKLDQGGIGACVGFASAHCINTGPNRLGRAGLPTLGGEQALAIYSRATEVDAFDGSYPPDDTGTTALAACKAMQQFGFIYRFEWAFGFTHGLESLILGPLMVGTYWTNSMFNPDSRGVVKTSGPGVGGHEFLWVGIQLKTPASKSLCWFFNSWGPSWGVGGYFAMTFEDFDALISRDGDLCRPIVQRTF